MEKIRINEDTTTTNYNLRCCENAIEIATNILNRMVDELDLARDTAITYIQQWGIEAESEYYVGDESYYDFIDRFSEEKYNELAHKLKINATYPKKAKLVRFEICTRVEADANAPEDEIIDKAIANITKDPNGYLCHDNVVSVDNDDECPIRYEKKYVVMAGNHKPMRYFNPPQNIIIYDTMLDMTNDFGDTYNYSYLTIYTTSTETIVYDGNKLLGKFNFNVSKDEFQKELTKFIDEQEF